MRATSKEGKVIATSVLAGLTGKREDVRRIRWTASKTTIGRSQNPKVLYSQIRMLAGQRQFVIRTPGFADSSNAVR